jgi:hypothetical protein
MGAAATPAMTRAGVVVVQDADCSWAWAASRVGPVEPGVVAPERSAGQPATTHNEHFGHADVVVQAGQVLGGVHVHGGPRPAPDDSAWLRSCWESTMAAGATVELRYLTRPDDSCLDTFLVVRTEGVDRDETEHRAATLRAQLTMLPSRLSATPVTEVAETHRVLEPFRAHSDGIVEIRKRVTVQRTSRDDARHPWLTAVTPLSYRRQSWDALWSEMAALPCHAMLSVGLIPWSVGHGLRAHLAARSDELARLARQGSSPTAGWHVPRPPDEFAVAAHALLSDAVRRYTDRAFHLRVSVAAERPVPGVLAELVADTISARDVNHGFAGAQPVVVRPSPEDLPVAWHNIVTLDFERLHAYAQGHPVEAIGELEHTLSTTVDLDEAAAAFRLPYRSPFVRTAG